MDMTLGELAALLGGRLSDETSAEVRVRALRPLASAGPEDLAFYRGDPRYLTEARASKAAAIVCDVPMEGVTRPLITVEDAGLATSFLLAAERDMQNPPPPPGVHPTAVVAADAVLGEDVHVGPLAVVESGARLGARTRVLAHAFVGRTVETGEDCVLHPGSVVLHSCRLGARVVIWSGAVIGRDGFGFLQRDGAWVRIPQVGGVVIGDDVEVGPFATIDRGALEPTVIEEGTKIDVQCHVAHNCKVGAHTLMIGATHLAGSVKLGRNVIMGPESGVNEHLEIGDGAVVAAGTKVMYDGVPPGGAVLGSPARPITKEKRLQVELDRLPETLREMRKRLAALEGPGKASPQ